MVQPTRLDYCQYLLSSPINYTLTHFADHSADFSHDTINRYLAGDRIPPRLLWEHVKDHIAMTSEGYVLFDDTVLDKRHARKIALATRQYSGNAHGVIHGIGVVTCVYVNPVQDRFWLIDYRIYDLQGDGKTKSSSCSSLPIARTFFSCSTRNSPACPSCDNSPISSRKRVPPSADRIAPLRGPACPV